MLEFLWESAIEAEGKEPASDRKRRKLRDEGICVFTPLIGKALALLWLTIALVVLLPLASKPAMAFASSCFSVAENDLDPLVAFTAVGNICWYLFLFCLLLPIGVALTGVAQVGFHWSSNAFFPGESSSSGDGPGLGKFFSGLQPGDAVISLPLVFVLAFVFYQVSNAAGGLCWSEVLSKNIEGGVELLGSRTTKLFAFAAMTMFLAAVGDYILRRRRFEVSIAMSPEEVRQEQYEDSGRPEVRAHRLERAQALLDGGTIDVALIDGSGGLILLGRHQGKGRPRIAGRMGPGSAASMTPTLRARAISTAYEPSLSLRLAGIPIGQAIPDGTVDDVVAVYRRCSIGSSA